MSLKLAWHSGLKVRLTHKYGDGYFSSLIGKELTINTIHHDGHTTLLTLKEIEEIHLINSDWFVAAI